MMQQKAKLNKIQNMRIRENARKRRLPKYLVENLPYDERGEFNKIEEEEI